MSESNREDPPDRLWSARLAALEVVIGQSDETVGHALIPFELGGAADVVCFSNCLPGRVAVTAGLIGI
jgi:hypothetical protein